MTMSRYVAGLWLWFTLAVAGFAELSVATYNVENYLVTDRMADGVFREGYPKPESEKTALRQVIRALAPDILTLQEMGGPEMLEELRGDLQKEGLRYPYSALLEASDPHRHVAVLSKVPLKRVEKHTAVPVRFLGRADTVKRGVLEVVFATNEGELTVFVIHLKSRRTEREDDPNGVIQRREEAEAVRDLVLRRFPDPAKALFVVCGDWNDVRTSRPVKALQQRGQTKIGEVVRAVDSRGETWTHAYRAEDNYSRIDYLMVSPGLRPAVVGGRGQIYDGPGVGEASDHRPVALRLRLTAVGQ